MCIRDRGILVLFQYDLWFGKNGYFDYKDVEAQIKENKAENEVRVRGKKMLQLLAQSRRISPYDYPKRLEMCIRDRCSGCVARRIAG